MSVVSKLWNGLYFELTLGEFNMISMKKTLISVVFLCLSGLAQSQCAINNATSSWSLVKNPNSKIDVVSAAAMGGTSCGLQVTTSVQNSGAEKHYVQDSSPSGEQRYRAAFCVDPNSVNLPSSGTYRRLKLHMAQCGSGAGCSNYDIVQFKLQSDASGNYSLRSFVRDLNTNTGGYKKKFDVPLADAPNRVEYDLDIASGTFKLWVNATAETDAPIISFSGLNLSSWSGGVNQARLGFMDRGINVTTGQTYYLDEFESRRQTFIGGSCQ